MHRFLLSFFCFVGKIISDLWFDSKTSMNVPRNRDEAASRSTRSSKKDHGMVMKEEERERKKKRRREKKKLFVCLERWRLQQTRWAQGEGDEVDPSVKVLRAHTE